MFRAVSPILDSEGRVSLGWALETLMEEGL